MSLFENVSYFLPETLSPEAVSRLTHVLNTNGATRVQSIQDATYIITNTNRFEGWQDVPHGVVIVTVGLFSRLPTVFRIQAIPLGKMGRPVHGSW